MSWLAGPPDPPGNLAPSRFAATTGSFAYLKGINGGRELVIYDVAASRTVVLGASHGEFWSISPSRKADAYYVSHARRPTVADVRGGAQPTATLLVCDAESGCRPILTREGNIGSVAELEGDRLLFVGGVWTLYAYNPRTGPWTVSNSPPDLFTTDRAGPPRRLTEWKPSGLDLLSVAGPRLFFQAYLPRRFIPGRALSWSEIYAADLSTDGQISGFDPATSEPAISYGDRFDFRPSLSPDGTMVAFNSAVSTPERKGWRYDVVVLPTEPGGKLVASVQPPLRAELSRPVFVSPTKVRYLVADEWTFHLKELDTASGEVAALADVPLIDIARTVSRTVDPAATP